MSGDATTKSQQQQQPEPPPAAAAPPTGLDAVLARASVKDRTSVQRHLASCEAEPDPRHAELWRKLGLLLGTLAPSPIQAAGLEVTGQHAALFFIPDGKYRMQVFALEDRRDGVLQVYLPDVLADAAKAKTVVRKGEQIALTSASKSPTTLQELSAANTPDPQKHYKNMIGWNRKAIRLTIPVSDTDGQHFKLAEALCTLAAKQWTK